MILGLPWMRKNKVNFDWEKERLIFPTLLRYEQQYEPLVP